MSSSSALSNPDHSKKVGIIDLILYTREEFIDRYLPEELADSEQLKLDLLRGKRSEFKTVKGSSIEQTKALEEQFRLSTELRRKYDTKAFDIYFALKGKFRMTTWHILAQTSGLEEIEAKGDIFGLLDLLEKVGVEYANLNPLIFAQRVQQLYGKVQNQNVTNSEHIREWNRTIAILAKLDPIRTRSADSQVGKTILRATERLDCLNFIRTLNPEMNKSFLTAYFEDCRKMNAEYVMKEYYYWKPLLEKLTRFSAEGRSEVKQEPDPQASLGAAAANGNMDRSRSRSRSRSPDQSSGQKNKKQKSEPECRHCASRGLPPWRRRHPSSQCKFA